MDFLQILGRSYLVNDLEVTGLRSDAILGELMLYELDDWGSEMALGKVG
jgi:hypothetical protein